MPVIHIVAFKFRADATAELEVTAEKFKNLAASGLPGLIKLTFGPTFTTERARGYTHALVAEFTDREALHVYNVSDMHVSAVTENVRPLLEPVPDAALALDYEI
ncbi:hypothetical protein BJ742DRAFT_770413 [Cladochytrium replicatum]|nr:hypothetical protein BJ742DRAFT_770413 [Cladochytrium replicatum]